MKKKRPAGKRRLGRWNVERERCRISNRYPSPAFREATAVNNILGGIVDRLGLGESQWMLSLTDEWGSIVGDAVAMHTRPGSLEGRILTVFVDSSVWLSEISRYGNKEMLEKIQGHTGGDHVRRLSFRLDPGTRATHVQSGT
ncbi:MAG: DUF721 domain-containing protein [Kiritimatiellia bacterium]|nr:DUF721 domain-containing protein [Kiritimatiellia bacterium]MDP6847911.1 DUF721 domain-containing protein [Kiritimatiellia bacterium]